MAALLKTRTATVATLVVLVIGCGQMNVDGQHAAESPESPESPESSPKVTLERVGDASAQVVEGGDCSLDTINGQPVAAVTLSAGDDALFVGWVGDPQGQVPSDARLVLTGEAGMYAAPVRIGRDRPDVVDALSKPGLAQSGFGVATTLAVEPGTYRVAIAMDKSNAVHCQFDVSLALTAQ